MDKCHQIRANQGQIRAKSGLDLFPHSVSLWDSGGLTVRLQRNMTTNLTQGEEEMRPTSGPDPFPAHAISWSLFMVGHSLVHQKAFMAWHVPQL